MQAYVHVHVIGLLHNGVLWAEWDTIFKECNRFKVVEALGLSFL